MDECKPLIDGICDKHRVEKIETIGDAYLAATGRGGVEKQHTHDVESPFSSSTTRLYATRSAPLYFKNLEGSV